MFSVPPVLAWPASLRPCLPLLKMLLPPVGLVLVPPLLLHAAAVSVSAARLATAREFRASVRIDALILLVLFVPHSVYGSGAKAQRPTARRHATGAPSRHLRSDTCV